MARIGIVGGTFDPIHNGHLLLGRQAYEEYQLDEIWYMPSGQPPHKKDHRVSDAADRCAMVQLAIDNIDGFYLSEFETSRQGNTYTAQTLALLKETYPRHEFYFIIGADSLYQIESWYHPRQVLAMVKILAADRQYQQPHPDMEERIRYLNRELGGHVERLHCSEIDISSEDIRRRVQNGQPIADLVPEAVEAYIYEKHLYQRELHLEDSL